MFQQARQRILRALASRYWNLGVDRHAPQSFWMAHPRIRRYINRSVTGNPERWPLEWFGETYGGDGFARGLVPGCRTGELERDLLTKGLCREIDAFDLSPAQIELAEGLAREAGLSDAIHYRVAAFDDVPLPEATYDLCCFHHALHHLDDPDGVLAKVRRALEPVSGLLYLDEYIGPNQRQRDRAHFALACETYRRIPARYRKHRELKIPGFLAVLADPSESIASDRIVDAVEKHFRVLARRDYHGFILMPIWDQLIEPDDVLVEELIQAELDAAASHPSWHTVIVGAAG